MLDGALGQVDSITRVITELCGRSNDKNSNSISDNSQFDSILPPEVPTSWVQCELCRKWRRVAWHVDGESLPDQVGAYIIIINTKILNDSVVYSVSLLVDMSKQSVCIKHRKYFIITKYLSSYTISGNVQIISGILKMPLVMHLKTRTIPIERAL